MAHKCESFHGLMGHYQEDMMYEGVGCLESFLTGDASFPLWLCAMSGTRRGMISSSRRQSHFNTLIAKKAAGEVTAGGWV